MTKINFLSIILFFAAIATVQSQEMSENALGLRLGDNDGLGAEVTYQRALNSNNRLEFDLGWRNSKNADVIKITGLYQWVFNLDKGFNWYVGAGGGIGAVDYDGGSSSFFYIAGDIGIEYNFDFPILISLDFRPEFGFGDFNDDLNFDIALGLKYQF